MRNIAYLALLFCMAATTTADAFCARCVEINENNKKKVNEFFYYDDYLEAQKGKEQAEGSKQKAPEHEELKKEQKQ